MSVIEKSLAGVLAPFAGNKYQTLFTSKNGFLAWNDNKECWEIQKQTPEDLGKYYNKITEHLMKTKAYRGIPNADDFIRRLNSRRTLELVSDPFLNPQNGKTHTIFFNSKDKIFNFLSNFHQTLILYDDHDNPSEKRLYFSCENAYQAHKAKNLLSLRTDNDNEAASDSEPANESDISEMLERIANASPLESKELASFVVFTTNSDKIATMKHQLMLAIVQQKFRDNPMLAQWLKKTNSAHLVENTNDSFWGAKDPHDSSLKKDYSCPITAKSRNVLGRILMAVRDSLG